MLFSETLGFCVHHDEKQYTNTLEGVRVQMYVYCDCDSDEDEYCYCEPVAPITEIVKLTPELDSTISQLPQLSELRQGIVYWTTGGEITSWEYHHRPKTLVLYNGRIVPVAATPLSDQIGQMEIPDSIGAHRGVGGRIPLNAPRIDVSKWTQDPHFRGSASEPASNFSIEYSCVTLIDEFGQRQYAAQLSRGEWVLQKFVGI